MQGNRTRFVVLALVVAIAATGIVVTGGRTFAQDDERLITLDLRDATLDDALRLVFRSTPYSYVLAPGVSGRVTLTLNNV
ncbi:MAG: STN domain-containing protein, partial [Armatimonadetes bacterium]|nr:STN domain-containing protein [Armatimonadota bacterium]